jgi:hypothetical protein
MESSPYFRRVASLFVCRHRDCQTFGPTWRSRSNPVDFTEPMLQSRGRTTTDDAMRAALPLPRPPARGAVVTSPGGRHPAASGRTSFARESRVREDAMQPTVDSITCKNKGAFVMKCHVKWQVDGGAIEQSNYSPEFPVDQEQKFDLNVFDIPDGASVWAHYRIEAGKSGDTQRLAFKRQANTPAVFEISGTTLDPHCALV